LYTYDFLSDRRNETYSYYLNDLANNTYYEGLAERLETYYPNALFTSLYKKEIAIDKQLKVANNESRVPWNWIVGAVLLISLLMNVYYISIQKSMHAKNTPKSFDKLTAQEQKIVDKILADKTNKEIASDLFISVSTVKTHINNLYKKLGVSDRDAFKKHYNS